MRMVKSSPKGRKQCRGKGEIARNEQFLLFPPHCFQKTCSVDTFKPGLVWERVNVLKWLYIEERVKKNNLKVKSLPRKQEKDKDYSHINHLHIFNDLENPLAQQVHTSVFLFNNHDCKAVPKLRPQKIAVLLVVFSVCLFCLFVYFVDNPDKD